ncbi:MAG: radical SAM protein [Tannerella sp.]|jgi:pyruvate formate lyase activating enzyme|nr:radical SAM protein [Tannerella sp.]
MPLMQPCFLRETLALCKKERFHTAVDTSGFSAWDNFDAIRNLTDLFLYDLKIVDNDLHRAYTGVSNAIIHENLSRLLAAGHRVRIRIPVVPNATFTPENISRSIALLKSMPAAADGVDLLPFHNTAAHKYARFNIRNGFEDVRSVPKNELSEIKQQFEAAGFDVRTGG